MNNFTRTAIAAGAAVTLMAGVSSFSASAAPLAANSELKSAVTSNTVDVQRRHRHRGRNAAIGLGILGAGIVAGAAINSNRGYYDQPYGYYDQPYGYYEQPYHYNNGSYGNPYDPYAGNY